MVRTLSKSSFPIKDKRIKKPEDIKGIDPVAVPLLRSIYKWLKSRGENLTKQEEKFLMEIEETYSDQETFDYYSVHGLVELLESAYEILTKKNDSWNISEQRLYTLAENITYFKAREGVFKSFFDELEKALTCVNELDFSVRVNPPLVNGNRTNIFAYMASALNIMLEDFSYSVVSMQSMDACFSMMNDVIVIVSDLKGNIRYVNKFGEACLGFDREYLVGQPISSIIRDHRAIETDIIKYGEIRNKDISVIISPKRETILGKLSAKITKESYRIEERVWIITVGHERNRASKSDLKAFFHDRRAPLNSLDGCVNLLKEKFKDPSSVEILTAMKHAISTIQRSNEEELRAITNKDENEYSNINIKKLLEKIRQSLYGIINKRSVKIKIDIDIQTFYTYEKYFYSIAQNLIENAIKYGKLGVQNEVTIHFFEEKDHFVLKVSDSGIGLTPEQRQQILSLDYKGYDTHGIGIQLVKEYTRLLNGKLSIESEPGTGSTFMVAFRKTKKEEA